jgi:hypothetical protein
MGKQRRQRRQRQQPVGLGRLAMLCKLKSSLDAKFIEELKSSKGLFKFLFVHEADILIPLVQKLLKYFDLKYNTFEINGHKMGITLQDVLFLCHLPINGKPVIVDLCPTDVAFRKVFGEDSRQRKGCVGAAFLTMIARDIDRSLDQRKIATLLVIIRSVIMPSLNGTRISTSFVELLENLDGVSDYAWGAALLAFLFNGIEKFLLRKKKFLDGNLWLILVSNFIVLNYLLKTFLYPYLYCFAGVLLCSDSKTVGSYWSQEPNRARHRLTPPALGHRKPQQNIPKPYIEL